MTSVTEQLRSCLQYIAVQLIDHPEAAQLRVAEVDENHIRFRLIVQKEDVAILIGRNGFTASAIRSLMKSVAEKHNVQISLQIHSHEEEQLRMAQLESGEISEE